MVDGLRNLYGQIMMLWRIWRRLPSKHWRTSTLWLKEKRWTALDVINIICLTYEAWSC